MKNFTLVVLCIPAIALGAEQVSEENSEFFEKKIRPLLSKHCYECHSAKAKKLQASLYLDQRHGMLNGGDSGSAVIAGKPDESLLIQSVRYESYEMPPKGKLNDEEIGNLVHWVKIGAPWPPSHNSVTTLSNSKAASDWNQLRSEHWAWQSIQKPSVPEIGTSWSQNAIDRFIFRKLQENNLSPSPPADRRTLIRRAYFDLWGMPPEKADVERFVNDPSPDAFGQLIDRLLSSPRHGERWGRHWLDVARYSDGHGNFNDRAALPYAYQYRDWVVRSLNADLRYDDFVRFQIAGDFFEQADAFMGTGFFAIGPTYNSDGGDPDSVAQAKSETLDDRVDTLSRAFLALTVSCARCHDHKFDPIPTLDYYSIAGIFQNSKTTNRPVATEDQIKRFQASQKAIKQTESQIKDLRQRAKKEKRDLSSDESEQLKSLDENLKQLKQDAPPKYPECHALAEAGSANMRVALRGDLRKPGPEAPRRFLRIIAGENPTEFHQGSGRRELAESIVDPHNPLTSRVIVNRIWQKHFGRGLVASSSNFGKLGQRPTHPELLDWLASEFVRNDWSIKWLHRTMMTSATYQMASDYRDDAFQLDGDNNFLWRMNKRRLDVESWRDSLLLVCGELDTRMGGPSVDNIFNSRRSTIYARISRSGDQFASDHLLRLFDFPTPRGSQAKRERTIVPQQFLFMMNNPFMIERAKAFAQSLEACDSTKDRIEFAYAVLFGRPPTSQESNIANTFLTSENAQSKDEKLSLWERYAQVLLSSNEFMQID